VRGRVSMRGGAVYKAHELLEMEMSTKKNCINVLLHIDI
jgi:hypothetical protein